MKIIKEDKDLIGKTIAFAHIAQFAENITIATDDGCVLVVSQEIDEDTEECRTDILNESRVLKYIESSGYLRTKLSELGIFDIQAYKQKIREESLKREQEYQARKLKEERETYERLKAKFENSN